MSLAERLKNQKRKIHSTFKIEYADGSAEVVDVALALVSDRQAVFAQAHNAGEMELFTQAQEAAKASNAEEEVNLNSMLSYHKVSARIVCRLLHKDNKRLFTDNQLEDAMSIPGFDELVLQAWEAFSGKPMGKSDGATQEEKSEG